MESKLRFGFWWGVFVCFGLATPVALNGCGDDDDSTSDTASGDDDDSAADSSCDGVCTAMFAKQGCFYAGGEADCRSSCNGWETQYVAAGADYCKAAWESWKSCMTTKSLTCNGDFNPDWNAAPCRADYDHWNNYCIQKNATPDTACSKVAALDSACAANAGYPKATSCFGNVPADCVVGGNENYSNFYCCKT